MSTQCAITLKKAEFLSYWIVVSNKDQVLVFTAPNCALVQWVNDPHVCFLLKAQQAALMEFHTVAAIRPNANYCPYYQRDLRNTRVVVDFKTSRHIKKNYRKVQASIIMLEERTIRLIRASRKRRTIMQTAMFPLRPLRPVL